MFWEEKKTNKINPVQYFYDWKSDKENKKWVFKRRNKETEKEEEHTPKQFIVLSQVACVKWRDEKSGSGIYSNEVVSVKNEDLVVRAFKSDKPLFEGKYDKDTIAWLGGTFNKGIIVLEDSIIAEYYLKGWALFAWGENTDGIDTENFKVKFNGFEEKKKWAVIYYIPTRIKWDAITEDERAEALQAVEFLVDFRKDD